ncbi:hypothetical protein Tco_1266664 [Tanacetum coccineum]
MEELRNIFHAVNEGGKRRMDDNILSSNDIIADSFFKPYLNIQEKNNIGDEQGQTKRKYINTSNSTDEQPKKNGGIKAAKFEAIKYSLGPNEEYIAIRRCEYDAWERNKENLVENKSTMLVENLRPGNLEVLES